VAHLTDVVIDPEPTSPRPIDAPDPIEVDPDTTSPKATDAPDLIEEDPVMCPDRIEGPIPTPGPLEFQSSGIKPLSGRSESIDDLAKFFQ